MANDLLSALRTYLSKVSSGEKTPQEMAAALNAWARESGESIKQRVEEEVARTVKKMGFAKQEELDRLAREVELLKSKLVVTPRNATAGTKSKSSQKKSPAKKTPNKAVKQSVKKSPAKSVKKSGKK
jgi:arsenate reductase-like glutaredoxin family protein